MLALGLLYLGSFSPDAVGYDAAWYHLVIAQDYAREGRIVSYMGDWAKNLPQLGQLHQHLELPGAGARAARPEMDDGAAHGVRVLRVDPGRRGRGGRAAHRPSRLGTGRVGGDVSVSRAVRGRPQPVGGGRSLPGVLRRADPARPVRDARDDAGPLVGADRDPHRGRGDDQVSGQSARLADRRDSRGRPRDRGPPGAGERRARPPAATAAAPAALRPGAGGRAGGGADRAVVRQAPRRPP